MTFSWSCRPSRTVDVGILPVLYTGPIVLQTEDSSSTRSTTRYSSTSSTLPVVVVVLYRSVQLCTEVVAVLRYSTLHYLLLIHAEENEHSPQHEKRERVPPILFEFQILNW